MPTCHLLPAPEGSAEPQYCCCSSYSPKGCPWFTKPRWPCFTGKHIVVDIMFPKRVCLQKRNKTKPLPPPTKQSFHARTEWITFSADISILMVRTSPSKHVKSTQINGDRGRTFWAHLFLLVLRKAQIHPAPCWLTLRCHHQDMLLPKPCKAPCCRHLSHQ